MKNTIFNVTIDRETFHKAIETMGMAVSLYDAYTIAEGEEAEKLNKTRDELNKKFADAADSIGVEYGTGTCGKLKQSIYEDDCVTISGNAFDAVKEYVVEYYSNYVSNMLWMEMSALFCNSTVRKVLEKYPHVEKSLSRVIGAIDNEDDIEIVDNKIGIHYWTCGAPAFLLIDGETGEEHDYDCEYDSGEYHNAIKAFRKEKEESIMTTEIMMKALTDNGYTFSRKLTDDEIKSEYREMLEDVELIEKVGNGANVAEAIMETLDSNAYETALENLVEQLKSNQKLQDSGYIKKDDLRDILNNDFKLGISRSMSRADMVAIVMDMYKDFIATEDEIAYGNIPVAPIPVDELPEENKGQCEESVEQTKEPDKGGDANLVTYNVTPVPTPVPVPAAEHIPVPVLEPTPEPVCNHPTPIEILERIIKQADTNKVHNFISDWMLTSVISELVFGCPLKGKDANGKWTEFYKSFTDEQKKLLKSVRAEFLKKSKFIVHKNKEGKATGYTIPAKSLVYGRHVWLHKACTYHFKDKNGKVLAVYEVCLNGIKRKGTDNVTPLDDAAYATLDSKCVFVC